MIVILVPKANEVLLEQSWRPGVTIENQATKLHIRGMNQPAVRFNGRAVALARDNTLPLTPPGRP